MRSPSSLSLGAALIATGSLAAFGACSDDGAGGGTSGGGGDAQGGASGGSSSSIVLTSSVGGGLPASFAITGIVVDEDDAPLEGALVLQGGAEVQATTGPDGTFEIQMTQSIPGPATVVAAKVGFRSAGEEIHALPDAPIKLRLVEVSPPDNALGYSYGHSGTGDPSQDTSTAVCGHCHSTFAAQFRGSAHANAAKDPIVQDLYAGVASVVTNEEACVARGGIYREGVVPGSPSSSQMRCYVGDGVLPDLNDCGDSSDLACDDPALPSTKQPTAFGACADCHGFGMDGPAGGRDLLEAEGVGFELGVHCDACHHVRDVDLDAPPGAAGRLVLQRPSEKIGDLVDSPIRQAMFGPLPDVPNPFMGGSYQPKFATADFCAGCHELEQSALLPGSTLAARFSDGLPVHSTYTEWLEGPFPALGRPCQSCHMPVVDGMFNSVDLSSPDVGGIAGGFARSSERNRSHTFRGPLTVTPATPRLIDGAVQTTLEAAIVDGSLELTATLENVGCGHAIPTGEPLRSLVLSVSVMACGEQLVPTSGFLVPDVGGSHATGTAAADVAFAGSTITWPAAASMAVPGQVVRVVRPSGTYWDYDGIGLFEGALLSPSDKGIELLEPVGEASVVSVGGSLLQLDAPIPVLPGDVVYLVDAAPLAFVDGDASRSLAGSAGMVFARVLVDPEGDRHVPHHRAIDIASDNRIGPARALSTEHTFAMPPGCGDAHVTATVLYRPLPTHLAAERGWEARDAIVDVETVDVDGT